MKMTKERRIRILRQMIKQEGACRDIDCSDCLEAFEMLDNNCPEGLISGTKHIKRMQRAERELIRLGVTAGNKAFLLMMEEEHIVLDQNQ
jgi:hypothetical protein